MVQHLVRIKYRFVRLITPLVRIESKFLHIETLFVQIKSQLVRIVPFLEQKKMIPLLYANTSQYYFLFGYKYTFNLHWRLW